MTRWKPVLLALASLYVACGDNDSMCTVEEDGGEVTIRCTNGTTATIPAPPDEDPPFDGGSSRCSVTRTDESIVLQCGDEPEVTIPIAPAQMDGGTSDGGAFCAVAEQE